MSFNIDVMCDFPTACGGLITKRDSTIHSPNYPNNYPNGVKCIWAINLGHAFQIEFDSFNTETSYDYLEGYNSLTSFTGALTNTPIQLNWEVGLGSPCVNKIAHCFKITKRKHLL